VRARRWRQRAARALSAAAGAAAIDGFLARDNGAALRNGGLQKLGGCQVKAKKTKEKKNLSGSGKK
jgi:hypothetical protein